MDKLDQKIMKNLKDQKPSEQYKEMINDTINQINSGEIERDLPKRNIGFIKKFQAVAAVLVVGVLSVTVYAGVTGKIDFNIGKTGNKKIDKNYSSVAQKLEQSFETDELKFDFISMAADPAYVIMEYEITLKENAIEQLDDDIYYFEDDSIWFTGYGFDIGDEIYINNEDREVRGEKSMPAQKISDNKYKFVDIINIADIKSNDINIQKHFDNVIIYTSEEDYVMFEVGKIIVFDVTFENKTPNILAEKELENGNTLYIEEVNNSKFENYVVARVKGKAVTWEEYNHGEEKEFMIEDPQYAICDENGNHISYENITLGNYFIKVNEDGSEENIGQYEYIEWDDNQLVRTEEVQLLRLGFEEGTIPDTLEIIPLSRKLYNDRTDDEENHYLTDSWYSVEVGETNISEELEGLGTVTITRIEESDKGFSFYYTIDGFMPSDIDLVVRVKDSEMNYYYPGKFFLKNIDSETENMLFYPKESYYLAGMPLLNYDTFEINDLEFAILYNTKYDKLSDIIEFEWPEESNQIGNINNIEIF